MFRASTFAFNTGSPAPVVAVARAFTSKTTTNKG
jgi:hypothetical protein